MESATGRKHRTRSCSHWTNVALLAALIFSTGAIVGYNVLGLRADSLGRKPTIWLYYLGALIASFCLFLLVRDQYLLLMLVAARGFFLSGQMAWMTIYLPELFPTRVPRHSNVSGVRQLTFHSGNGSAAGWLVDRIAWSIAKAAATMSLIYLIGLIVTPFARHAARS
jgi:MFS family permease